MVAVNIRYYSEESSYGVVVFHTTTPLKEANELGYSTFIEEDTDKIYMSTLVGNMQPIHIGSEYEVVATLEFNQKFNTYQYKAISVISVAPKTELQQKIFLESVLTNRQAETLLSKYPNIVNDIINGVDNVDISELKGIGEITFGNIKAKILENYVISDVLVLLQPFGIKYNTVKRLLKGESNPSLLKDKLTNNPYILLEIHGFGFKTVDGLALKINPKLEISDKRTYAFIDYYLKELGNNQGHTWVTVEQLTSGILEYIPICADNFKNILKLEREKQEQGQKPFLHFEDNLVGLESYYRLEINIFNKLKELQEYSSIYVSDEHIENGIKKSQEEQGFELTEEQLEAVKRSLNNSVCLISGSAGTGKTSSAKTLLNIYKEAKYSISCCALSAKASQVITESTGFQATTIHRLLGATAGGEFLYNANNKLPVDVLLIDECSMINASIFYSLVSAIAYGTKVIMMGDFRQLPPIGFGNIFNDLIKYKTNDFCVSQLTKVLRQAEKSGILSDANKICKGINPLSRPEPKIITGELQDMYYMFRNTREELNKIAINTYLKSIEQDGIDNVVLAIPRREKCENSTTEINNNLNEIIIKDKQNFVTVGKKNFYIGSKVIQIENNYEKNIFNGEIGYVESIQEVMEENRKTIKVVVRFVLNNQTKLIEYDREELGQLDLAYALTIHKLQGSGYKTVIIVIDMTHYTLLDTCLVYTALTRAKSRCLLLAEPNAFKMSMANNKTKNRQTWLSKDF